MLKDKRILVGVTGSIAAYKAAMLIRLLIKEGAQVRVIMTASAKSFITPLTLATLSKNLVYLDFLKDESGEWHNHVALGLWADAFVVAPATANTIAKFANGFCDNFLTAVYLSARCPVFFAPAMDLDMHAHPSTTKNINQLTNIGNIQIPAESGELASGLSGTGRMCEPENIIDVLKNHFNKKKTFNEKKVLITAGPTYELIDPVRFIGNHSTGKMGFALAESMAESGAQVNLITGPTHEKAKHPAINTVHVVTAEDMYQAALQFFPNSDIAILSAAVADYKPQEISKQKIKKKEDNISLNLVKTTDIAASLGKLKKTGQFLVGFALETENETENAIGKMQKKNLDLIVLNSLNDKGAGFSFDTNKIQIIYKDLTIDRFELKTKQEVAQDIVNSIIKKVNG